MIKIKEHLFKKSEKEKMGRRKEEGNRQRPIQRERERERRERGRERERARERERNLYQIGIRYGKMVALCGHGST